MKFVDKPDEESQAIVIEDSLQFEYGRDSMDTQAVEMSQFMNKFAQEAKEAELVEHVPEESGTKVLWKLSINS